MSEGKLSTTQIKDKFVIHKKQMDVLERTLTNVSIKNDEECNIAIQSLNKAKDISKELEKVSDELKHPYKITIKNIDSYFKKFSEPLSKAMSIASKVILNYKTLEAAKVKEKEEENLKNINEEIETKKKNLETISNIGNATVARLFGGIAKVQGNDRLFEPVKSMEQCESMRHMFMNKFPDISKFGDMAPTVAMIRELGLKALNEIESQLRLGNEPEVDFLKKLYKEKIDSSIISEKKALDKELKRKETKVHKAVQVTMKGTRKQIKFDVVDQTRIPSNYLEINKRMVSNYIAEHRDVIKKRLDDANGKPIELIGGIYFYYERNVIG